MPKSSPSPAPPRQRRFSGLLEGVRRLLVATPPAPPATEHRGPVTAPSEPPPPIAAGRFSLVGLSAIREALGPRWDKVAPKVHALAEAVIAGRLQPGDIFERSGEDGYVVLLPRLDKAEADLLCQTIAREIAVHLLGTEWEALAEVESVRADVPLEALASGDPKAALDHAFVSGVRTTVDGAGVRQTPVYVETPSRDVRAGPRADAAPWIDQTGFEPPPRKPWTDVDLQGLDVPRLSAGGARDTSAPTEAAAVAPEWRYAPIWDFRQQALIRFRLHAAADGRQVHPYQGLEAASAEPVLFENDLQALSRITADFAQLSAQGRRLPIICPIHYSSISLESRRSWLLHTLREVPPALRRLLTIEIVRPHGAVWTNSLYDFAALLRGSGAGLAACLPLDRAADIPLVADSARAINAEAPRGGITEKRCIELLDAFAVRAHQCKLECGVYGLGSRSLVVGAAAAGFRFMSGEAIHPELETPDTATRFQPLDLYQAGAA